MQIVGIEVMKTDETERCDAKWVVMKWSNSEV